ncbi:MAG: hypothetical protein NPIRA02_00570 [Nitrospirales bacterium]|nr:MAG: hypothetical protein NPIRA02_00570 [Nitrospirales bacterium]
MSRASETHNETSPFLKLWEDNKHLAKSIIHRYRDLDPIIGEDDLLQEAFLALPDALAKWEHQRGRNMQFSNYYYFFIQKRFQAKIPGKNKIVQILNQELHVVNEVTYAQFRKSRRRLVPPGFSYRICTRILPLPSENLERYGTTRKPFTYDNDY